MKYSGNEGIWDPTLGDSLPPWALTSEPTLHTSQGGPAQSLEVGRMVVDSGQRDPTVFNDRHVRNTGLVPLATPDRPQNRTTLRRWVPALEAPEMASPWRGNGA